MSFNRKKIISGISAAAFLGPFTQTVYTPSLLKLQAFFHVNTFLINLTISLFTAILAVSNFVIGPIADKWGRRATLLPGMMVFVIGSLICLFSTYYEFFLLGRAVQAVGISTAILVAPTVIGDIYPPNERARAMSLYQTINLMGPVFGPVVGGLMAAAFSWQAIFGVLVAGGVAAWLYNRVNLQETLPENHEPMRITLASFATVFGNRSSFSIILLGFSQMFGYYLFLVFLPKVLDTFFTLPASSYGFFFVPLTAGLVLGVRLGNPLQRYWTRTRILGMTSLAIGLAVLLFWLTMEAKLLGIPALVVFLALYGLLLGCSMPVQSTILVNVFERQKGTAVGIYNFSRFMGAALGPLAGGLLVIRFNVETVFLSLGLLLVVAAFFIYRNLADPYEQKGQRTAAG
ncbi:Predicted arabinose efflux permease, MFS family [Noviherbaspirillum humi]|uniref:Predicted arabinose efflux permease, MFS family n=1 Tax=Noviherbaspirillum humi TaxID=1688639 RepID=A0A239M832_9BURK|nr:MFS transporter [Noviherbaspirillum humi]SNT38292.1 Predicted arabinose efflux permease, MFS family [Noviherbaspirillum humi]